MVFSGPGGGGWSPLHVRPACPWPCRAVRTAAGAPAGLCPWAAVVWSLGGGRRGRACSAVIRCRPPSSPARRAVDVTHGGRCPLAAPRPHAAGTPGGRRFPPCHVTPATHRILGTRPCSRQMFLGWTVEARSLRTQSLVVIDSCRAFGQAVASRSFEHCAERPGNSCKRSCFRWGVAEKSPGGRRACSFLGQLGRPVGGGGRGAVSPCGTCCQIPRGADER